MSLREKVKDALVGHHIQQIGSGHREIRECVEVLMTLLTGWGYEALAWAQGLKAKLGFTVQQRQRLDFHLLERYTPTQLQRIRARPLKPRQTRQESSAALIESHAASTWGMPEQLEALGAATSEGMAACTSQEKEERRKAVSAGLEAYWADLTPQQREERGTAISAGLADLTPQEKEEWGAEIGKGLAARTPQEKEEWRKAIRGGMEACWAHLTPQQKEEWVAAFSVGLEACWADLMPQQREE